GKRRARLQHADRSRIVPRRPDPSLLLCAVAREVRPRGLETPREICRRARLMKLETGPLVSDVVAPVGTSSAFARRAFLPQLDNTLLRLIELAVAALIAVETVVLLAGVIARYVFLGPLIWSDDLASLLFMWLIMLGAVLALRRGAHMRLTVLLN